jgi:hypothetical protein
MGKQKSKFLRSVVPYLALPEGVADGHESLQGDGDDAVDAAGEGDVDEGEGEGGEVGQQPDVEGLGEGGQAVLHKYPALKVRDSVKLVKGKCLPTFTVKM